LKCKHHPVECLFHTEQVASNISGTASDAVKTVVDAAGVVSNHVGDAVAN